MPDAAAAHTKAGAKAFMAYFWRVVNYAETTGDVKALKSTFVKGCGACEGGLAGIRAIYRNGGHVTGGQGTVVAGAVLLSYAGPFVLADLKVTLKTSSQRVDYPGTVKDSVRPGAVVHDMFHLSATDGDAWRVAQFEVIG
ncbi:DUF6318 family protein [Nocardioides panacihumi]